MNLMSAKFCGVVSPTAQDDGFYVPVFNDRDRSNQLLVQIVDENGRIESFEPFFTTANVKWVDLDLVKNAGDPAFWYFELESGPLFGDIESVRAQFRRKRSETKENPFTILQVMTACKMDGQEAVISKVRDSLSKRIGQVGADAWLDTNILSPRIRAWLNESPKTGRRVDFRLLTSKILAFTRDSRTTVLIPQELKDEVGEGWSDLTTRLTSLLGLFGLQFGDLNFLKGIASGTYIPSDVPLLKREAVSAFAKSKSLSLRQMTKSYFETASGGVRVVCTFSSRYEKKGKRKYWYGYHKIWDRWLEGASEGFLLLGCRDSRLCFALPLDFVRAQLSSLRSTGTGKDQYWHLDIVDVNGEHNLLDVPRLGTAIAITKFSFTF